MTEPRVDGRELSPARTSVIEALRAYTVQFEENVHHLAKWMALPGSDTTALMEVIWAETSHQPMTPARLSHRLGMTSGATTALLNRLESAGHVVRSRESSDRRVVTVRPSTASRERAQQFFDEPADEFHALLNGFSDDAAARCADMVNALVAHMVELNRRLREAPPQAAESPRAGGARRAGP